MTTIISAYREFPLGEVLGKEEGQRLTVTARLRGGPAAGQYQGEDLGGRPGTYVIVTIGPEQSSSREALERDLALRVSRVVPVRGVFPLSDGQGQRYQALVEAKPVGKALVERRWPLGEADSVKLAIELAETVDAASRLSVALVGIRPELTYVKEEGGQLELTGLAPRGESFLAGAGARDATRALFSNRYAAPEVAEGQPGSTAGDVFSLCALVAHVASGEYPFEGADPAAQLDAMRAGRRRPWSGPPSLGRVLEDGLAVDPARRPTPGELIEALRGRTESAPGLGAKLLGFLPRFRKGGGGSPHDDDDEVEPSPPSPPSPPSLEPFPLGAQLSGGEFFVIERLQGERWRGRYRGQHRDGTSVLITIGGKQTADPSSLHRELALDLPGVAPLRTIGPVEGDAGGGAFDGMVEDEPAGHPIAGLRTPLGSRAALGVATGLGSIVARAHASGQVIGGLAPELIYVAVDAGVLVVSGIAPRAERFLLTASRPSFALPDLFASVYLAPEVLSGGGRSPAADVFAVSALTAEWMSGHYPFEGDNYISRVLAIQQDRRRPLDLPDEVRALLERGLHPRPERRPSMEEWLAAASGFFQSGR